ncbi:MAG: Ribose 5-phosphate isomerase [Microgenomates group bacterium GW2011_GWC2_45_8]|nr:MAG: Ribose 5-phosphate isomerase [Microgenomates group bacterium GW2011_GWC2_45_8]KKU26595.1 MAG: Ribose 5-phosphate isomerase [Microgenomates group bacterium GW2011_GWA2_46_16]
MKKRDWHWGWYDLRVRIYLGADHRGFELKEILKEWLVGEGYEVEDIGNHVFDPDDDSMDPALKVAESIEGNGTTSRGILLCGSGHGVDIVANRFPHVRAILAFNETVTVQGREHEDANVLVLPAEWMSREEAIERVRIFLETEKNDNPRYERRRMRIANLNIR